MDHFLAFQMDTDDHGELIVKQEIEDEGDKSYDDQLITCEKNLSLKEEIEKNDSLSSENFNLEEEREVKANELLSNYLTI